MSDQPTIYCTQPLRVYLNDAGSGKPAPGGGSVSACVGALGAALVAMVGNLTLGKEKFAGVDAEMRALVVEADAARAQLEQLLQDDTVAYNGVIDAYKLPKETAEQQAARAAAVQAGLIVAADVPMQVCRVAAEVCRLARTAAGIGNPAAITDAGIGAILGEAAALGAALNVKINLGSIKDAAYVQAANAELETILAETAALRAAVLQTTLDKI
jgi:formiminotetrahydrofolate cyclodeaminase